SERTATARRPAEDFCGPAGCTACVARCPHGALSVHAGRVEVDARRCTGCGACVSACPAAAMSLGGVSVRAVEEELRALLARARGADPATGIVITCADAPEVPLGAGWLPLEVPSMAAVTLGWAAQVAAAGIAVRLAGCDDPRCADRAGEITRLWAAVASHGSAPRRPGPVPGVARYRPALTLREPAATVAALAALRVGAGPGAPWRVESPLAPVGDIRVDAAACSACGRCAAACSGGALAAGGTDGAVLTFDGSLCSACGACVAICPEAALSLRRVIDPAVPAQGRRVAALTPSGRNCSSCGEPIGAGLATGVVAARLAASHPLVAARLVEGDRCAQCRLR
ncbi:MAG: 4Fe-4S dicluster domain-containing protein, partial [Jatrophihabitans sp.]